MEKSERRPVSLAGLGLIGAGAILGLTLAAPAQAAPTDSPRPASNSAVQQPPQEEQR
jgi:hypothetical protein